MTDLAAVPALKPHFRLQWEPAQDCHVLLYPEGMIKLNGSAGAIMACVDGERSIADIVATLQQRFPEAGELAEDTLEFFDIAHDRRWIDFG